MAAAGVWNITRGPIPLRSAVYPSLAAMWVRQRYTLFACSSFLAHVFTHSVCCRVFTTSNGFVMAAASAPADPPASRCVLILSSRWSRSASAPRPCACPRNCLAFSYTEKCTTVYGTFIRTVVRYDRKKGRSPSSLAICDMQSHTPLWVLPGSCNRCFTTSIGSITPSAATVASAPDTAATAGSTVVFPGPMSICLDFSYAAK
mmetsp:Transcript_31156/g.52323  ORF Transcript_31156/g.52323 Transcript_31156/m.52323 type:complete len:203 (+) Transcript_31156:536-1144(+)